MPKQPPKILVIEDEIPMAKALELKLNRAGYNTSVAYNGEAGLKSLQKTRFDAIILDLIMPEMDGFTVLAELKEKNNTIPIIVHSSLSQPEDIKRVKELGATEYFTKHSTPLFRVVEAVTSTLRS